MLRRALCCLLFSLALLGQRTRAPHAAGDGQISGMVVDSDTNQPIPGARVAIAPVSKRDDLTTVVSGDDGRFSFSHLAAGKYALTAQHRGYLTQRFNQHEQFGSAIAVGPGLNSANLVFRMTAEGSISGVVTDEEGESVRDAHIMLFQVSMEDGASGTHQRGSTLTDDEGHYHFSHLPAGKYYVAVSAQPWYAQYPQVRVRSSDSVTVMDPPSPLDVAYPITFYSGATDSASATPIQLGKGEKLSADLALHPVPAAHFQVEAESPDPAQAGNSHVLMEATLFDGVRVGLPSRTVSSGNGVMEVVGLPPGNYIAKVEAITGGSVHNVQEQEVSVSGSGVVEQNSTAAMTPVTATLQFEPPSTSAGQLSLVLRDTHSNEVFAEQIGGKGEIEFKSGIPPGQYELSLQNSLDAFIKRIEVSGAKVSGRTLVVKGNTPVKLNLVVGQGMGEVSGTALRDDKPFAGAMVVLVPADPANNRVLFRRDQSDSDGTFRLANVVPGQYTLLAIEEGWDLEWSKPAVLQKFLPQGEALTVEVNSKPSVKVNVQSAHRAFAQE